MPVYCPAQISHRRGRPVARDEALTTARTIMSSMFVPAYRTTAVTIVAGNGSAQLMVPPVASRIRSVSRLISSSSSPSAALPNSCW